METSRLIERVHELADLELAMLLCLMAKQHCIIECAQGREELLEQELQLIASNVFDLSNTVVHCNQSTTLEDFSAGVLVDVIPDEDPTMTEIGNAPCSESFTLNDRQKAFNSPTTRLPDRPDRGRCEHRIANVVIVTNLTKANEQIQIQTLELLRTRRLFTHTEIHTAPKDFIIVIVSSVGDLPLVQHLNDHLFISHHHEHEDGYTNLEEASKSVDSDANSISSVIRQSDSAPSLTTDQPRSFAMQDVQVLADWSQNVKITPEVKAYLHNLVVFLRLNRAVAKGISPTATKHLDLLSRILTTIHGNSFATPAIIGLAFRKVYRHRVQITTADFERSVQYGSHPKTIASILDGITVDSILENVLQEVEVPV